MQCNGAFKCVQYTCVIMTFVSLHRKRNSEGVWWVRSWVTVHVHYACYILMTNKCSVRIFCFYALVCVYVCVCVCVCARARVCVFVFSPTAYVILFLKRRSWRVSSLTYEYINDSKEINTCHRRRSSLRTSLNIKINVHALQESLLNYFAGQCFEDVLKHINKNHVILFSFTKIILKT